MEMEEPTSRTLTKTRAIKIHHKWTIDTFDNYQDCEGLGLESTTFSDLQNKFQFKLKLYSNYKKENLKFISLYLILCNDVECFAKFRFTTSKKLQDGKQVESSHYSVDEAVKFTQGVEVGTRKLLPEGNFRGLVHIECTIKIFMAAKKYSQGIKKFTIPPSSLPKDLTTMFESMEFADVTFIVQEQKLQAHRAFLVARSPVFKAMFTNKMLESQTCQVTIDDLTAGAFKELLRFIYTGEVNELEANAKELLCAADKYHLDQLRAMCEESLCSNLSPDNAIEIFEIADLHNATMLADIVINYINRKNLPEEFFDNIKINKNSRLIKKLLLANKKK